MNPETKMAAVDHLAERPKQAEAERRERKLGLQLIVDGIPTQVAVIAHRRFDGVFAGFTFVAFP
jgi:hypothetical protein